MMKTTIVLDSKADLRKERNNLKAKGFTEVTGTPEFFPNNAGKGSLLSS